VGKVLKSKKALYNYANDLADTPSVHLAAGKGTKKHCTTTSNDLADTPYVHLAVGKGTKKH
jgi:hypothetical protein